MRSLFPFVVLAGAAVCALAAPSCKTATVIRAKYTTDFGCKADGSLERAVMFSIARSGDGAVFDGKDPSDATFCTPGERATVGDDQGLVLRPNPDYSGTYELVAIVGTEGTTASACNLDETGAPRGGLLGGEKCIVARRKVRFVDGVEIKQNVFLSSACAGVVCPADRTCNPETKGCIATVENSETETGGTADGGEIEGGPIPVVDASVPDVGVDASTPILPCAPNLACTPGAIVQAGAYGGDVPPVAAHEGKIAFVHGNATAATVALYDYNTPTTIPLELTNPADSIPIRAVFGFVGNVKLASVVASFQGPGIVPTYALHSHESNVRATWQVVPGSGASALPTLLSDGAFYAGFVEPSATPGLVPFAKDSNGAFLARGGNSVEPSVAPFVGTRSGVPRFAWLAGKSILSIGQDDNLPPLSHTNGLGGTWARLVTFGPADRIVAIDDSGTMVLLGNGAVAANKTILTDVATEVVTADDKRIYALVGKNNAKGRLLAISKASLAQAVPSMCEIALPTSGVVRAVTHDAACLYFTTTSPLTGGTGSPNFAVQRSALAAD